VNASPLVRAQRSNLHFIALNMLSLLRPRKDLFQIYVRHYCECNATTIFHFANLSLVEISSFPCSKRRFRSPIGPKIFVALAHHLGKEAFYQPP